jgi:microcystin-dependent protein
MPSAIISSSLPGSIVPYAGGSVPSNYLLCNGASYATATYPQLFAVIGYTFGGSGANFNVPNTERSVLMGSGGTGTATIGSTVGSVGGEENHVLSIAELAAHTHGPEDGYSGAAFETYYPSSLNKISLGGTEGRATLVVTGTTGSSDAHNTIQPSVVVTHMIRF